MPDIANLTLLHLYEINQVRRHQRSLDQALNARSDQLWLQTSEGPKGTPGKTQIVVPALACMTAAPSVLNGESTRTSSTLGDDASNEIGVKSRNVS